MIKDLLQEHKRIKDASNSVYDKLEKLLNLYAEKGKEIEFASLIPVFGSTFYVQHELTPKKMEGWLRFKKLAKEYYKSCPVDLICYSDGNTLVHHGHHRIAAQIILGGAFIYAVIQRVDSEWNPDGFNTIDEVVANYLEKAIK